MIRNNNAVNVWLTFEAEHGREPTRQDMINMGYSINYYYQVKRKVKDIKKQEQETIQTISNEEIDAIFAK